jgi:hypothetical protein
MGAFGDARYKLGHEVKWGVALTSFACNDELIEGGPVWLAAQTGAFAE